MNHSTQATMVLLMLFIAFSHPLTLVVVLVLQTLPMVMMVNFSQNTNWLSYMLFLIFLGGLLIIFTYLSALIPNEMFPIASYTTMVTMIIIVLAPMTQNNLFNLKKESMMQLSMFSLTNTSTTIPMMIVYLLATLCVAMLMCNKMKSPLKQNNN